MSKKKIIFIDDEANVLQGLKRSLRPMINEWDMTFLQSGKEALELLAKNEYNIVVTDYKMPDMDGIELFKIIKEKHPKIKLIMLSGQSETEIFETAGKIADKYISKPCDHESLINTINEL